MSRDSRWCHGLDAGKVEAKPIHMHVEHPIAKAIENETTYNRMIAIEGIATSGVVLVVLLVVGQVIVDRIVDAPEIDRRTLVIAFSGVVVYPRRE